MANSFTLTHGLQDPACCRTLSVRPARRFCCFASPLHSHRTGGNRGTRQGAPPGARFTSSSRGSGRNVSHTSGTWALLDRFPGREGEEKLPPHCLGLPPLLRAELQPLFCSAPCGILSPSTMKSVTFKLLYCNLGTCALPAGSPCWAPTAALHVAPHAIANIDRSAPRCNQRR